MIINLRPRYVCLFALFLLLSIAGKTSIFAAEAAKPGPSVLLIDDFDQAYSVNHLGGGYGVVAEGGEAHLDFIKPPIPYLTNSSSLKISYKLKTNPAYAFLWMKLGKHKQRHEFTEYLDLTDFIFLSFKYQARSDMSFKIELHEDVDGDGKFDIQSDRTSTIYTDSVKRFNLEDGWTKVLVPLKRFTGIKDWSKMLELVFVFEKDRSGASGEILFEDLLFIRKEIKKQPLAGGGRFFEKAHVFFGEKRAASDQMLKGENHITVKYVPGPRFDDLESISLEIRSEKDGVWFPAATEFNPGPQETSLIWEAFTFNPPPGFSLRVTAADFFGARQVLAGPFENMRVPEMTDDDFLNLVSYKAFLYFKENSDPASGLFFDATGGGDLSTAVTGFGLTALVIGAEHGWISKEEAMKRVKKCLQTFLKIENKDGFFYHFIDSKTLKRAGNSEISTVDTAILLAGMITAGEYFGGDIKKMADQIYRRVKWNLYLVTDENDEHWMQFRHGWTPEEGMTESFWDYYTDETILVDLLGIGAPANAVPPDVFYHFQRREGKYNPGLPPFIYSWHGSLFSYQYAGAWYDLRNQVDEKGVNWFENSTNATLSNRAFAVDHAHQYKTFGKDMWGITGMRLVDNYTMEHGPTPNGQNKAEYEGTVSPSGPGGSMIFTPYLSLRMLKHLYLQYPDTWGVYGFKDSINIDRNYISPIYYGLGEGILLLSIENFRSGLVWNFFMKNEYVKRGLKLTNFSPDPKAVPPPSAFEEMKKQVDSASAASKHKAIEQILKENHSHADLKLLDENLQVSLAGSQDPKILSALGDLQFELIQSLEASNLEMGRLYLKHVPSYKKKALEHYEKALKSGLADSERLEVYTKMIQLLNHVMSPLDLDKIYEQLAQELKDGIKRKSYNLPWALKWADQRDDMTALRLRREFYGDLKPRERKLMFESFKRKAKDFFAQGDYPKAALMFEEQIRFMEAPTYRRVLISFLGRTAKTFTEIQRYGEAEKFYLRIIDDYGNDQDREAYIPQFAAMLEKKGDKERAVRELEALIDAFPKSPAVPEAMVKIAALRNGLGERDKAIEILKKVSSAYPTASVTENALYLLGKIYFGADRYSEAIAVWEDLLKKYPNSPEGPAVLDFLERANEKAKN